LPETGGNPEDEDPEAPKNPRDGSPSRRLAAAGLCVWWGVQDGDSQPRWEATCLLCRHCPDSGDYKRVHGTVSRAAF